MCVCCIGNIYKHFLRLCFSDELNVDYNKLVKNTAVEGLRVEDLVKKYFEAAEKVTVRAYVHAAMNTQAH